MKIYTKKGDKGKTQLLGGSMVGKNHEKLECYGTIDELNSFIGNIYDDNINLPHKSILRNVQNQLFKLGSIISFDGKKENMQLQNITHKDVTILEESIDYIEDKLPTLNAFILPSGHPTASKCHIARTVCRRAERRLVSLGEKIEIDDLHLQYLNRLSDYLFMLARAILHENQASETEWQKD